MKRKILLVISLVVSIIGICSLFFVKPEVSPQSLQLSGFVKSVNQKEKVAFISFVPDDFLVVSFEKIDLKPGNHTLTGRLQHYKGRVEFVVESYD
ncbi:hypothetical protein KY309_02080 [Candidatus Woesearchaeota archaeon]|nr:hypothetical protein [Candidatus Woesearchaeota archaeon]MBW3016376.1 hypothetical protein [Candidatus Woesearchaeota archaeon]